MRASRTRQSRSTRAVPRAEAASCRAVDGVGERRLCGRERFLRLHALGAQALDFDAQILGFDVEASELAADALPAFFGALDRVLQRRRRLQVDGGAAPRRVDVAIERPDLAPRAPRGRASRCAAPRRPRPARRWRPAPPSRRASISSRAGPRRASRCAELAGDLLHRLHERRGLLLIERDLLLPPLVLQLALVRFRAQAVGLAFGLGQLDAHALEIALDLGEARRRDLLALADRGERFARRADGLGQPLVALREEQLLPPAQLAAQPLVATGLAGLPLQRGALALELVDEIVDAGEVLLRRFELELGLAAARLELGDAGGFLDQLAAIGRLRAEDLADLALLDDGVALHADADVHQDVLHVAQADGVAVDQVLALAGAIEAAADLDVAGDRRRLDAVALPIDAVGGGLAVEAGQRAGLLRPRHHAAQVQPDLGRGRRLAGVAAAEDHVLHPVAAQALGALLAEHPGDGVDDVALAAAVRADDGGHARVEPDVGAIGKALEAREFESFEAHGRPECSSRCLLGQ